MTVRRMPGEGIASLCREPSEGLFTAMYCGVPIMAGLG